MTPGSRGLWCTLSDPNVVRICAGLGFDWLALDAQHGDIDRRALVELGRTLTGVPVPFAVRVPELDFAWIGAALDAGASTVIVPQVDTAAEAAAAVTATFYPPTGGRSWGPFSGLWGAPALSASEANAATRCAVMIESATGLANVDEIAAVPGVAMLFVGPFDLSLSLGIPVEAGLVPGGPAAAIVAAAAAHQVEVGAFAGDQGLATQLRSLGVDCLAVATDVGLLKAGGAQELARG